jgi:hypothetical protein
MASARDFARHEFRDALDIDLGIRGADALGDGIRHRLDVAVAGIVEDEDLGHF